jgi:hypothetical protein
MREEEVGLEGIHSIVAFFTDSAVKYIIIFDLNPCGVLLVALTLMTTQFPRNQKLLLAVIASQCFFISFYVFLIFEPIDLLGEVRAGVVII